MNEIAQATFNQQDFIEVMVSLYDARFLLFLCDRRRPSPDNTALCHSARSGSFLLLVRQAACNLSTSISLSSPGGYSSSCVQCTDMLAPTSASAPRRK